MGIGSTPVRDVTHFFCTDSNLPADNAFRDDWLKIGKLYPCVGFRDDGDKDQLRVEIFLPGSGKLSSDNSLSQSD